MDAHLALEAETECGSSGHFEAFLVVEIDPNRVEGRLDTGGA